ncbi:coiled-coil domain-containing protein 33 [Empidonax traillii]|uniref:coiled-coil domain-containing protein 33 n=1 Tax=Empidonax traillii TaxID=164674 RepID=UPI000FFD94AB|nr:coiled-coil domain-containing protein 33 [Empidonax traillii]
MAGKAGEPHIPLALQRSRLKAEEKTLDFEFEVVSAQFNRRGCYALRLTVENPLLQGSGAGIQLRVNGRSAARSSTGTTDTVEQSHLNRIYSFQRRKFTFTLPRGFCKNDKNHDVRLHIEALRFPGRAGRPRRGRRVGEAFFAIYPRLDQPRLKLSARRNEDWYRYSAVVALLRVGSEQPAMHCGRLAFTVSLHEHRAPPAPAAPPPRPPSSQEDQQAAGTAPASPDVTISPRSPRTPESAYHSLPAEGHAHFPESLVLTDKLLSDRQDAGMTLAKTSGGAEQKPEASRASSAPTHAPTWEEEVMVEMDAEDAAWAVLTLTVADKPTKEALGTFQLPVRHLQPFQPHHCRLVLPRRQDSVGVVLHVTITRRKSFIPRCDGLSYVALEVLLRGLSPPLTSPPRTLIAVARVVTNVQEYKHRMEKHPIPHPGISPTTILFPDPPAAAFSITRAANHGCPQISRPAGPQEQPSWNASFLFQGRDAATIFSEDTALTIEFYPYKAVWDAPGTLIPVGYSVLPLTSRVFQELAASSSGMHVEGLAVEVRKGPWAEKSWENQLFLMLQPPGITAGAPAVAQAVVEEQELHQDDTSLPAVDAMASILPGKQPLPHGEQRSQEIFGDRQEREVDSYRLALKRMAGDLLSLRRHVTSLEVKNGHLRCSLASQQELGHSLLHDDDDLDAMTREELLDRLATLKHKLVASTAEMRRLKDRVQQLQNELIRKNDREKELVLLQRAHRLQQAMLRRCQDKVAKAKGLVETVQQQEKVIEVMERVLQEKLAGAGRSTEKPAGEALSGEVHTALLAENRRLREELARAAHPAAPIAPRPPTLPGVFGGTEKLSLLARLEEAQARGRVLERQLEKAARKWGREKQELGTRLLEQENGFPHPSNLTAVSTAPRRRPHTLPPLP